MSEFGLRIENTRYPSLDSESKILEVRVTRYPEHVNVESGSEVKSVASDYTNPITNPKTLTTLNLTLTDPQPDPNRTSRRL